MEIIPPPFNMVVAIVFLCSLVGVVKAVASEFRKYAVRREELQFKREMIERGLEVDEVERMVSDSRTRFWK